MAFRFVMERSAIVMAALLNRTHYLPRVWEKSPDVEIW